MITMAAGVSVKCPGCGKEFGLRLDPGVEDWAIGAAEEQLRRECPNHEGKKWEFWDRGESS
jgi:hypothetical protein